MLAQGDRFVATIGMEEEMRDSVKKVLCLTRMMTACLVARECVNAKLATKSSMFDEVLVESMERNGDTIVANVLEDVCDKLRVQFGRYATDSEIFDAFTDDFVVRPLRARYIREGAMAAL